MKNILIFITAFLGVCIYASAQEKSNMDKKGDKYSDNSSSDKAFEKTSKELRGDKYFFSYSFDKAIVSYNQAKELSLEGKRRLAQGYHNIDQNLKAEEIYSELSNTPGGMLPEDCFNYAMVLKTNGKYEQANIWIEKFIELKPNDLRAKDYEINKAELMNLLKDEGKYKIEHMNINTEAVDFGASYYKNEVVFASSRTVSRMIVKKYNWTRKPFWDMYVSEVDEGQLKDPRKFDKGLNRKMNDGPASFSNDGTFMAFTRNNYNDKSKDRVVELQIFFSSNKEGKWSKPESFILNNKDFSVGQPCLTSDGKTMYFTSDMPGGFGGADIYRITKDESGNWGKEENMGNKINTEGDEMFPFFEETKNVMFFSSNGLYGIGGLDIFICEINGSEFGGLYNAGYPLNTQFDDFAAVVDTKIKKGYFSSNRSGGSGNDDIYAVEFLKDLDFGFSEILFTVHAPENIPVMRRVRETFPIRNYVFFDLGSTEIPDRYVLLKKDQVKEFKEDQLEVFLPKKLSGRSARQMTAYYNVLNILGDRMGKNPATIVRLCGASMEGEEDGLKMAESVKKYLVDVFGIKDSRITTEGSIKPKIPSEKPGFKLELELLREGDHRVSIWSESPELMMEFQSGPDAPLKPVLIQAIQEAPLDSYVSFSVDGAKEAFTSWTLDISDELGNVISFGPYTQERVSIPGKSILGSRSEGDFKVTMIGKTKSGMTVKRDTTAHMVLWTPMEREEGMRFSIIYEFNESDAIKIYEKYLTDIIIPKIPEGGLVIISGYTDVIGTAEHNQELSLDRANDVKEIFVAGLAKAGRNDVKFEVNGFGENLDFSPFENNSPEERFYNRTVIIDIIPQK